MDVIKDSYIQKAIDEYKCPEPSFCPINTTVYESQLRERKCLKCWIAYCKENNIEIDYEY